MREDWQHGIQTSKSDGTIDDTYNSIHIRANATENRLKWCEILMAATAELTIINMLILIILKP